jgi:NAD(P) transhydrogenase subunit beta
LTTALINLLYLGSAILFILGIKQLSSPATARRGNLLAALGMLIAIASTLCDSRVRTQDLPLVFGGILIGSGIGIYLARTVKMTGMPQMVALLNGFGGAASALVAAAQFGRVVLSSETSEFVAPDVGVAVQLSVLVGGLTFSGSVVAFAKLQDLITGKPITYPFQKLVNLLLLVAMLALGAHLVSLGADPGASASGTLLLFSVLNVAALALGVLFVIPIGGADMPVVISLLNSFSGVAAAFTGFVIRNNGLIITGALVGASGLILTRIMCIAMNRSLWNVLFGAFGGDQKAAAGDDTTERTVKEITPEDAATLLCYARQVIFVPGYGLAVAQAQHQVRELADILAEKGVEVKYAIHPVAGRMPGHMNVLLAEADVPYDQLYDMDQANPEFERTDVAVVIGANDVVNPAARSDTSSPIYGMPILDVDSSANVIVMKRSMNPGFAGIENHLFYHPKTKMLFGDAKSSLSKLITESRAL